MRKQLLVLGAGGHSKVVIATALSVGFEVTEVLDDDEKKWGSTVLGIPVRGPIEAARDNPSPAVLAIGDNVRRKKLAELSLKWATVIHPSAEVHESVVLGDGAVVFAGATIQPDTTVGMHTIINTGATVDHDCVLEDYVHVAPGVHLSGGVHLEEGVFMGIGSCAIPGTLVGAWTVVGAGAAVVYDLLPGCTAVGIPAQTLRESRDR